MSPRNTFCKVVGEVKLPVAIGGKHFIMSDYFLCLLSILILRAMVEVLPYAAR